MRLSSHPTVVKNVESVGLLVEMYHDCFLMEDCASEPSHGFRVVGLS